ncbi:MAG: HK97 family phage prohead protease [Deltaproteobacteria bacterium]|nr:HK97 family phage prohead protease [Deltaproteobacteria bacterium]
MKRTNMRAPVRLFADGGTESRSFTAICSTAELNSHGFRIDQKGWDLRRFKDGGPVLLEHNVAEGMLGGHDPGLTLPIGRATNVRVEDGALRASIAIVSSAAHPLADRVVASIREKSLLGISVGARILDENDEGVVTRAELMELSVCAIPADPGARIELSGRRLQRDTSPIELRWKGRGWALLSFGEKHAFLAAEPARARRAQAAARGELPPMPRKPYGQLSATERQVLATHYPETFAKARAAHRRARGLDDDNGGPSAA